MTFPKITQAKVSDLLPYANNAREHTEEQVAQVAASIKEFGWTNPIITHGQTVVAGHARLAAARKLGLEEVPVIDRSDMSEAQWKAYVLADNQLAQNATWNEGLLTLELDALAELEFDLDLLGFPDLDALMDNDEPEEGLTDPDEVPEPPADPITQPSDLWILGEHRLLCGDSTDPESVAYLMDGEKADMVFTDPPYGMGLEASKFADMPKSKGTTAHIYSNIIGDSDDFTPELITTITNRFIDAREMFIWGGDYFAELLPDRNEGSWVVWDKRQPGGIDNLFGSSFELCWSKTRHKREIARILWAGYFGMSAEDTKTRVHPTQKPVALAEWFFERWGMNEDVVVDLYLGSGTTLIAAERLGRKCYGIEIDPIYCDVIVKRWEDFTGKKAERHGGKK